MSKYPKCLAAAGSMSEAKREWALALFAEIRTGAGAPSIEAQFEELRAECEEQELECLAPSTLMRYRTLAEWLGGEWQASITFSMLQRARESGMSPMQIRAEGAEGIRAFLASLAEQARTERKAREEREERERQAIAAQRQAERERAQRAERELAELKRAQQAQAGAWEERLLLQSQALPAAEESTTAAAQAILASLPASESGSEWEREVARERPASAAQRIPEPLSSEELWKRAEPALERLLSNIAAAALPLCPEGKRKLCAMLQSLAEELEVGALEQA